MIFYLAIFFQIFAYSGFIYSSLFFFKNKDRFNIYILLIKILGPLLIFSNLYFTTIGLSKNEVLQILGIILMAASSALFYWTYYSNRNKPLNFAFTDLETQNLIVNGPYKYIRHPFYASYTWAWLSGLLINQNYILVLPTAILILLYCKSAIAEQNGFLSGEIKESYATYVKSTGFFFPKLF